MTQRPTDPTEPSAGGASPPEASATRHPWRPLLVERIGSLQEIVRAGGGKSGAMGSDPGDILKPPGQG